MKKLILLPTLLLSFSLLSQNTEEKISIAKIDSVIKIDCNEYDLYDFRYLVLDSDLDILESKLITKKTTEILITDNSYLVQVRCFDQVIDTLHLK